MPEMPRSNRGHLLIGHASILFGAPKQGERQPRDSCNLKLYREQWEVSQSLMEAGWRQPRMLVRRQSCLRDVGVTRWFWRR
jgi:hypothetical protein